MRFPDEHGERNHYDCGDTYDSNFPSRETNTTRQAERFEHDDCPICDNASVPCENVPDQALRGCPKCEHVWFEDLASPVRKAHDATTAQPLPQTELPFTASEFQERIKRQLFGSASVEAERAIKSTRQATL